MLAISKQDSTDGTTVEIGVQLCAKCGQSLNLWERVLRDEHSIFVPGVGEYCPSCYRTLSDEEWLAYFGPK